MIKVYASGASRSRRVLWALEELGAPYEVVELQFPPRLHHPEFIAVNPSGAVPMIEDGDLRLTESLVICEYLSRKFGGDLVVGPDEPDYWTYRQLTDFGEATLQPALAWARRFGPYDPAIAAEAREAFTARVAVIDRAVADGRPFLAAGRLTLADLSVGFAVTLAPFLGLGDLVPRSVKAYAAGLRARPAYRRAYGLKDA